MVSGFAVVATLGILLPSISSDLGLSPSQQGLLGSAAVWGNLGLAIPVGWWMSRYRPKMVLTVTQVVGTLFIFLQGWAGSFTILLLGRLALGMSLILRGPAKAMLTQQWFSQREIPLVNSASNAIFNLVVAGGLLTTPFILKTLGDDWRKTFYVFAVFFAVLTVLWAVLGRERGSTDYRTSKFSDEVAVLKRALSYRDVWLAGVGFAGATVAEGAFFTFFPHSDARQLWCISAVVWRHHGTVPLRGGLLRVRGRVASYVQWQRENLAPRPGSSDCRHVHRDDHDGVDSPSGSFGPLERHRMGLLAPPHQRSISLAWRQAA